jgi:predicted phosphohydrolase
MGCGGWSTQRVVPPGGTVQGELESVKPYTDYQFVVRHKHGYWMAATSKITNSVVPCIFHYSFSLGSYLLNTTPILHVRLKLNFTDVIKNCESYMEYIGKQKYKWNYLSRF